MLNNFFKAIKFLNIFINILRSCVVILYTGGYSLYVYVSSHIRVSFIDIDTQL